MGVLDGVLLALLGLWLAVSLRAGWKRRKSGGCCGDCSGCCGCSRKTGRTGNKTEENRPV